MPALLAILLALTRVAGPAAAAGPEPAVAPVRPPPVIYEAAEVRAGTPSYRHHARLAELLSEVLGAPVVLVPVPDASGAADDVQQGAADFAFVPPLEVCVILRQRPEVRYVATARVTPPGEPYDAVVFTRGDSGIRTLADARGAALALVDRTSASGYLFPLSVLSENGLDAVRDFRKVYLMGSHAAVIDAVAGGFVDVGGALREAVVKADQPSARLRILARTPPLPAGSLLAGPGVDDEALAAVRGALFAPDYVAEVGGDAAADPDPTDPDFGWVALSSATLAAPCEALQRLRAAQRSQLAGDR